MRCTGGSQTLQSRAPLKASASPRMGPASHIMATVEHWLRPGIRHEMGTIWPTWGIICFSAPSTPGGVECLWATGRREHAAHFSVFIRSCMEGLFRRSSRSPPGRFWGSAGPGCRCEGPAGKPAGPPMPGGPACPGGPWKPGLMGMPMGPGIPGPGIPAEEHCLSPPQHMLIPSNEGG